MKPFCEATDQNKERILRLLQTLLADAARVFEVGSGTGQHAVHFAHRLTHLRWQTSDLPHKLPGIRAWLEEAALPNTPPPVALDVLQSPWPAVEVDAVFSANTAHIFQWPQVEAMFQGVGRLLVHGGLFCLYGPFSFGGAHVSESNARFHAALQERDPGLGVRDVDDLNRLALAAGMTVAEAFAMPVNNHVLVWRRRG